MKTNPFQIPSDLVACLREATSVVAFTGAGISAESGVPTFRDAQTGLWEKFSPAELATWDAFAANPQRVWEWYEWRRQLVSKVTPNPGHVALTDLLALFRKTLLVTQNVDGLHQQAGAEGVIELHGNLFRTICSKERTVVPTLEASDSVPPCCPRCNEFLRPDVVWFGESLPIPALQEAQEATMACDVFLSIGTSTTIYPAAELPFLAREHGARVIEINPESTSLTPLAHISLQAKAGVALPAIVAALGDS